MAVVVLPAIPTKNFLTKNWVRKIISRLFQRINFRKDPIIFNYNNQIYRQNLISLLIVEEIKKNEDNS
jgi:hypothetical protein